MRVFPNYLRLIHRSMPRPRARSRERASDVAKYVLSVVKDPRVVALLVLGFAAMKAKTYSKPVSDTEILAALKMASWARVPTKIVRRFLIRAGPLAEFLQTRLEKLSRVYTALERIDSALRVSNGRVPLDAVVTMSEVVHNSNSDSRHIAANLHAWASDMKALFDACEERERKRKEKEGTVLSVRGPDEFLTGIDIRKVKLFPDAVTANAGVSAGTYNPPGVVIQKMSIDIEDKHSVVYEYYDKGIRVEDLKTYFGESPDLVLIDAMSSHVTHFPTRKLALRIFRQPNGLERLQSHELSAESRERVVVDTKEVCVLTAASVSSKMFKDLWKCKSLEMLYAWTLEYTRTIADNGLDGLNSAVWALRTLARRVREHVDELDETTVDKAVYVALAARVIGFHAMSRLLRDTPIKELVPVRNAVFAVVVRVASRVAQFAHDRLGAAAAIAERDLNLFYEPTDLGDFDTVRDYGDLCRLMYDKNLLRYVAPGIEPDALPPPLEQTYDETGLGTASELAYAGWGYVGVYEHTIPEREDADLVQPPRYFGVFDTWDACELRMTAEGSPAETRRDEFSSNRDTAQEHVRKCGLKPQQEYWKCIKTNTAFRALNVVCAALTVQDSAGVRPFIALHLGEGFKLRQSRCSVSKMLHDDGSVRVVVDMSALCAGLDTAPYGEPDSFETHRDVIEADRDKPKDGAKCVGYHPDTCVPVCLVCAPERVHMHFSRGHYARGDIDFMFSTDRVVGMRDAVVGYAKQQNEYDKSIYERSPLRVSLAARQWRKNIPAE